MAAAGTASQPLPVLTVADQLIVESSGATRVQHAVNLAEATAWLETYREYWEGSFQRLDAVLAELKAQEAKRPRKR